MTDTHHQQPTTDEEQDVLKTTQQEQQAYFAEEVPENQMMAFLLQGLKAFGLLYGVEKVRPVNAFEILNDPNFEYNLLKVKNPEKFKRIKAAYAQAKKVVEEQRKKEAKSQKPKDYAQVSLLGPFRRRKIRFTDFDRKEQALKIASAVQNQISATEIKIRIERTVQVFGLDDQHALQLKRSMASWLKDNPGRTIEDYLFINGRRLYLSQNGYEKKKTDKKTKRELKKREEDLAEQFKETRIEAVEKNKETVICAQQEIKQILEPTDPNEPILPVSGEKIRQILQAKPQVAPSVISVSQPSPTAPPITTTPQPEVKQVTPPSPVDQISPIGPASPQIKLPLISRLTNLKEKALATILNSSAGQFIKTNLQNITSSIVKMLVSKLTSTTLGTALKTGLFAALGVGTGGASLAVQTALAIGRRIPIVGNAIDLSEKTIKYVALAAVIIPVLIIFLAIFLTMNVASNNLPYFGVKNSMRISFENNKNLAWGEFEKKYLTVKQEEYLSWQDFEKEYLTPPDVFLTENK